MLSKGLAYEKIARKHLECAGLKPVDDNFRSRYGEIDLIMLDQNTLVFIEVKYRQNDSHGTAAECVTHSKQKKIIKCAETYLSRKNLWHLESRFDVVAISPAFNFFSKHNIQWHKGAFY